MRLRALQQRVLQLSEPGQTLDLFDTDASEQDQTAPAPSRQAPEPGFPVPGWDRYELVEFIGAGGMGKVYRARDPRLCRDVALKFILTEDERQVRRFLREARIQARAIHDNICKIYEVGEVEGHPYIAMQFINGRSLKAMNSELPREQKIKLTLGVAEAIQAAHRLGLIHRDIKPSNIMVEQDNDGLLRPYVMDFGIAREFAADGQTMTVATEGSPHYMAPEQTAGGVGQLDRRSDIYSLGATLYELLAGRPPFVGSSMLEVIFAVLSEDVKLIRELDPSIPLDLEAIVMKCLERKPQARYDSARALAEDLQRYLDGEPVHARRATWRYLALKKAKKHKALVALGSIALLSVLVFGGAALRARWKAAEQASLAQQIGQDVEAMQMFLRYAYALPLHDTSQEKTVILERMRGIEARIKQMGDAGEGPGRYALGRGHLALHRYNDALSHLEAAWSRGYRTPEVEYALGLVLGELYKKALEDGQRLPDARAREARAREAEEKYLGPALQHVQRSSAALTQEESPLYVEGLIAFYAKRNEEALEKARRAFEASPWLYEAKLLEGAVLHARGGAAWQRGDKDEATRDYELAAEAYGTAARMAESDATAYQAECRLWFDRIDVQINMGRSPRGWFNEALATCDSALKADPDNASVDSTRSMIYARQGADQGNTGEDPRASLTAAIEAAQQAVKRNPEDAGTYDSMGIIYWVIAGQDSQRGMDPRATLERSAESLRRAIAINPNFTWPWNDLGLVYKTRAEYELEHGIDPRPTLWQAIKHFETARRTDPTYAYASANMCMALVLQGKYEVDLGVDPQASLDRALESCDASLRLNPHLTFSQNSVAEAHLIKGRYDLDRGQDARPPLERATSVLTRLIQDSRADIFTYQLLSQAHQLAGLYLLEAGADPAEALASGRAAVQKMLELGPNEPLAHLQRGRLAGLSARRAVQQKEDPAPLFSDAAAAFDRSLALNLKTAETYQGLAELYRFWAEQDALRKTERFREHLSKGGAAAEQALALSPQMAQALAVQGALEVLEARAGQSPAERQASALKAQASLAAAVKRNPLLARRLGAWLDEAGRIAATPL